MVFYEKLKMKMSETPLGKEIVKVMTDNENSIIIGLTKITLDFDILKIEHSGRHDHTIGDVDWSLSDSNLPFVNTLKEALPVLLEQGHPDYYYVLKVQV